MCKKERQISSGGRPERGVQAAKRGKENTRGYVKSESTSIKVSRTDREKSRKNAVTQGKGAGGEKVGKRVWLKR